MKNNWKEVKLGDISTDVSYGYTESASDEIIGPKFLRITDIVPYFINWDTVPYCKITEIDFKKYKLKIGDIVIARTGATSGYNARITKDMNAVFASYLIRFRINENVADSKFISYILKSARYNNFIANSITGSAQPGINAKVLSSFTFKLPSEISEQKRIADILSSFDDKIELLQKQNKTLEDMAKAIFKSWFVDFDIIKAKQRKEKKSKILNEYKITEEIYNLFPDSFEDSELGKIPKSWEVKKLKNICNISSGKRPNKTSTIETKLFNIPVYGGNGIKWYSDKSLFNNKIIITGRVGTLGEVYRIYSPCWVSDNALVFITKENLFEYIYNILSKLDFHTFNRGSTQPLITQTDIKNILLLFNEAIILKYHNIVSDLYNKIESNKKQINTLSEIRDTLLPKLISGTIRV